MNSLGGLSAFFYNVIPGVLFLLVLIKLNIPWLKIEDVFGKDPEKIFWIIIIGLFLGFFDQAAVKLLKGRVINESIFKEIQKDNDAVYKDAQRKLAINGLKLDEDVIKDVFYGMDNYLRNSSPSYIINHYSERAAFWANVSLGLIVIISILLYEHRVTESLIFILLFILTRKFFLNSVKSQYESVLQTFVQTVKTTK